MKNVCNYRKISTFARILKMIRFGLKTCQNAAWLTLNQWVQGSNPCGDTKKIKHLRKFFASAFFVCALLVRF